jgi:uncharacterized protein (DUF58 family)
MKQFNRYIKPLFIARRLYIILAVLAFVFVLSYWWHLLLMVGKIAVLFVLFLTLLDFVVLFYTKEPLKAERLLEDRLSNGDENKVHIAIHNRLPFKIRLRVIDELPDQFQKRDFIIKLMMLGDERKQLVYTLRPTQRGEYYFHDINLFFSTPMGLLVRRYQVHASKMIRVMPAFFSLRKYELLAHNSNMQEAGTKRLRKLGHSMEFEQIKEYIVGDDIRTINWKATARRGQLMVNNYTDERMQQVYCIIDKGRVMQMPFEGMSLLDYAINATLVLSKVALLKQDKAGLVTFADGHGDFLAAERKGGQMNLIFETLYNQQTKFLESSYEELYARVRTRITQRSLVILFSNFESLSSLQRQLPFIKGIASKHLLLVVFFENTELRELTQRKADTIEQLYTKIIAEKFAYEKRLIVKELQQQGILAILSRPQDLTANTVNKYLELKARQAI